MVEIKVKSLWQGKVGIRDKFIYECRQTGQDLKIIFNNEIMVVKENELVDKIVGKSDKPFSDRFSRESHYLIYFNWQPTERLPEQIKLL